MESFTSHNPKHFFYCLMLSTTSKNKINAVVIFSYLFLVEPAFQSAYFNQATLFLNRIYDQITQGSCCQYCSSLCSHVILRLSVSFRRSGQLNDTKVCQHSSNFRHSLGLVCFERKDHHGGTKFCDRHVCDDPVLGYCWRSCALVHPERTKQRVSLEAKASYTELRGRQSWF